MNRRIVVLASAVALVAIPLAARANPPPVPEPNFATTITKSACTVEANNPYEEQQYKTEGWTAPSLERYPGTCQRLHFAYGPIHVKPGQNDVLVEPITIEKPAYDGYVVRFRPDLVRADGSVPPIEEVHLHHGVWISLASNYGDKPFFASGEEKTILDLPKGFGFPVRSTDTWQTLYMIHNLQPTVDEVWMTYDIDYVKKSDADALKLKSAYPVWMDVRPSAYPVFNVERSVVQRQQLGGACTWPKQQCADFDPWGATNVVGQGQQGNNIGTTLTLPARGATLGRITNFQGGTFIEMAGHVHPGGLSVDLEVERAALGRKLVYSSDARYWDWNDPTKAGGPPTSWDLSMTSTSLPRWAVHVAPGDELILNTTYDATVQSTYEDMGIMVGFLAADDPITKAWAVGNAIDPFASSSTVDVTPDCASGGLDAQPQPMLCVHGVPTHGHMTEANNKGGRNEQEVVAGDPLVHTDHVAIGGFSYAPGGPSTINRTGIPTVSLRGALTFTNLDSGVDVYHTVTSCPMPCNGATGIAYPLASTAVGTGSLDFDSGELGYGPDFGLSKYFGNSDTLKLGPAKNQASWTLSIDPQRFHSGGTYSYFCRIHPAMRGYFQVQ